MKTRKKSDLPGPYTNSRLFLRQARTSGKFSDEELSNLKREFQHHKDKIHEYNILMDTVSRTEGETRSSGLDCGTEVNESVLSSFRPIPHRTGLFCTTRSSAFTVLMPL